MRIGIMTGSGFDPDPTLPGLITNARRIEAMGFDSLWMATIYAYDGLTALTAISTATTRIELGTAVAATHPRHPMAMAQQALTVSAASQGRFTLGIGLSHKYVIETEMGLSYQHPVKHMREYLQVLMPLLRQGSVKYQGELFQVDAHLEVPAAAHIPVLIAALGSNMLELAGQCADGTTVWMTGPLTLAEHCIPTITKAASAAGKAPPRIVAGLPIVLTDNIDEARDRVNRALAIYRDIPSYRAMLDREGADGPGDIALLGDETSLRKQLHRLRDIGVTDFNAVIIDTDAIAYERTLAFLSAER